MKRRTTRPIIFSLTTVEPKAPTAKPRILPFPGRDSDARPAAVAPASASAAELGEVRERLFRMIVANQWERSHGNRAS